MNREAIYHYTYKPGWNVYAKLAKDNIEVRIEFNTYDADYGEPLRAAHSLFYQGYPWGLTKRWFFIEDGQVPWLETSSDERFSGGPLPAALCTLDGVVYDACCRFELHEVRHWLRGPKGDHVKPPHPELEEGDEG